MSGLPGRFKAWIYQHSILPRILWPLLIYTAPMTTVESLKRKISGFFRKWLGEAPARGSTRGALYGTSLESWNYPSVISQESSRWHARDKSYNIESARWHQQASRIGRKRKAVKAVEVAETLVRVIAAGTAGLGYFSNVQVSRAEGKKIQHLLQEEVQAGVEEEQVNRDTCLRQQGAWTRRESALQHKLTEQTSCPHVQIVVQAVYDTLPSPTNLHVWGKSETHTCPQCSWRCTLGHLLSICPKALAESQYR